VLWHIIAEYGPPKILQSDNGPEFVNKLISELLQMCGVEQRLIAAYHPRANGLVERTNKEVKRLLAKLKRGDFAHWEKYLPAVQMALNIRVPEKLGSTPFTVMTGRPFNAFEDFSNIEEVTDLERAVKEHTMHFKALRDIVYPGLRDRTKEYKNKKETEFDNWHTKVTPFIQGEKVWVEIPGLKSGMDAKYEGPYIVKKIYNDNRNCVLADNSGSEIGNFTTNQLKRSDPLLRSGEKKENNRESALISVHGYVDMPVQDVPRVDTLRQNRSDMVTGHNQLSGDQAKIALSEWNNYPEQGVRENSQDMMNYKGSYLAGKNKSKRKREKIKKRTKEPLDSVNLGQPEYYTVDKIVADRKRGCTNEYLIHWKGYDKSYDTWEPYESFTNPKIIRRYWSNKRQRSH
ncbi:MAG: hypothetical protein ACRDFB_00660, partial [Rhabdochlamydiaceae bacterium]